MYTPTNTQISELIQRARNQGVSLNFSQAKKYLIDNYSSIDEAATTNYAASQPDQGRPQLGGPVDQGGVFENAFDAVGSTLYNLLDSSLLGLPGLAFKNVAPETYESVQRELSDTTGGRIGSAIGGLAGFLVPYSAAAKGIGLGFRGLRGAQRFARGVNVEKLIKAEKNAGNLLKGKKPIISAPTTRDIQKIAAAQVTNATGLKGKKAFDAVKKMSDESVGFTTSAGFFSKASSGFIKPAYQMSDSFVFTQRARGILKNTIPNKLQQQLASNGINLNKAQVRTLADDLVETLGTRPINTWESYLATRYGSGFGKVTMSLLGAASQDAMQLGIVGTTMDYVARQKNEDNPLTEGKDLLGTLYHHAYYGAIFGPIKYIPGGRDRNLFADLSLRYGTHTRKQIKRLNKMSNDQLRTTAIMEAKNSNFIPSTINGTPLTVRELNRRYAFGQTTKKQIDSEFKNLRNQLITHQRDMLDEFRNSGWIADNIKDFVGSIPRMLAGSIAFNIEPYQMGAFDQYNTTESLFHIGFGALMTKRGKAMFEGEKNKMFGMNLGDKDYVYNSDLRDVINNLEQSGINMSHVDNIASMYSFDLDNVALDKVESKDLDNIISKLEEGNIISLNKEPISERQGDLLLSGNMSPELQNLINPIIKNIIARGYNFNNQTSPKAQQQVLNSIKNLQSEVLGTADNPVYLNSPIQIRRSYAENLVPYWTTIRNDIFEVFKTMARTLSGQEDAVNQYNQILDLRYNGNQHKLNTSQQKILQKFEFLKDYFIRKGSLTRNDISFAKQDGFKIDNDTAEFIGRINEVESVIDGWETRTGEEFEYGTGGKADISDPLMYVSIDNADYHSSVTTVSEMIKGKKLESVKDTDLNDLVTSMNKVYSAHGNNSQMDLIIKDPTRIEFTPESIAESNLTAKDVQAYQLFLKDVHSIATVNGKSPTLDFNKVEVDIGDVVRLHEQFYRKGMPDYLVLKNDTRLHNWVQKSIKHGLENLVGGLDLDRENASVVQSLIQNGIIATGDESGNPILEIPTVESFEVGGALNNKDLTIEEKNKIIEGYKVIVDNLSKLRSVDDSYSIIRPVETFTPNQLSKQQLLTIGRAADTYDLSVIKKGLEEINLNINENVLQIETSIKTLEEDQQTLSTANRENTSEYNAIISALDVQNSKLEIINGERKRYADLVRFGISSTRAAAIVQTYGSSQKKNILKDLFNANTLEDINTISDNLKKVNSEISRQILQMPEVNVNWDTRNIELENKHKHEEIEGRQEIKERQFTLDRFMIDYNIQREDLVKSLRIKNDSALDTPQILLKKLFLQSIDVPSDSPLYDTKVKNFVTRISQIVKKNNPSVFNNIETSSKVRDELTTLTGLLERSVDVQKITIVEDGGTYENSVISQGFLTDMWADMFNGERLTIINSNYIENGMKKNVWGDGLDVQQKVLNNPIFTATNSQIGDINIKLNKSYSESVQESKFVLDDGTEYPMDAIKPFHGESTIVRIDENVALLIKRDQFNKLSESFIEWYNARTDGNTPEGFYVRNMTRKYKAVKNFWDELGTIKSRLEASKVDVTKTDVNSEKTITANEFDTYSYMGAKENQPSESMYKSLHADIHTMFNSMYGEMVNKNWLADTFGDVPGSALKEFKYRRLPYNLGYVRNADLKRKIVKELYVDSNDTYAKKVVEKYTDLDIENVLVIDDSNTTKAGETIKDLITDARSQAKKQLDKLKDDKKITTEQYEENKKQIQDSPSLDAEEVNGMTIVRKDMLDYRLIINGERKKIDESSGQKPVGISSYVDENGNSHTFYNKTHYFYDKRLDTFFKENPDIHQIAFTSGAKKNSVINKNGDNIFIPLGSKDSQIKLPKTKETTLTNFINGLKIGTDDAHVFKQKFNQTLSGNIYGSGKDVRIMKQFDNFSSRKVIDDVYQWGRIDMIQRFSDLAVDFYDPKRTSQASALAKEMLATKDNADGTLSAETENLSTTALFIEGDGVPFSSIAKSMYDNYVQKKYITDSGALDGFTSAGGSPVLRGNLDNNLSIPIYSEINGTNVQTHLGEANISKDFLDRDIYNATEYGAVQDNQNPNLVKREKAKQSADIVMSLFVDDAKGKRDILINLKDESVYDPYIKNAALKNYKEGFSLIAKLRKGFVNGDISKWRDIYNITKQDDFQKMNLALSAMPAPRTGPHDHLILKLSKDGLLDSKDGSLIELNNYDVTLKGQRDFDTDKLPFYLDAPFSSMAESMATNAIVREAEALALDQVTKGSVNIYDYASFNNHLNKINTFKKLRGNVIKMHRKITYLKSIFDATDGIKINIQGKDLRIKFDDSQYNNATQELVTNSQAILDIYNNFTKAFNDSDGNLNVKAWENKTLYDNSNSFLKMVDSKNNKQNLNVAAKSIVNKLINDYSRILTLEGNVYESGDSRSARYVDMVRMMGDFKNDYRPERINWEMYYYLQKKDPGSAFEIFFNSDDTKLKNKAINNVLGNVSEQINQGPTLFMKSMLGLTRKDYMSIQQTVTPQKNGYNQQLDILLGKARGELLNRVITDRVPNVDQADIIESYRDIVFDISDPNTKTTLDNLWDGFNQNKNYEEMFVQANTLENDIRRTELMVRREMKKGDFADSDYVEYQLDNLQIKTAALNEILNRLNLENSKDPANALNQTFRPRDYYGKDGIVKAPNFGVLRVVDTRTGAKIKDLVQTSKDFILKDNQGVIENPVTLRSAKEHDVVDAVATAFTVNGVMARIQESDIPMVRQKIFDTKRDIRKTTSDMFKDNNKLRDWDGLELKLMEVIDKNVKDFVNKIGMESESERVGKFNLPKEKETYVKDFLLSLIGPDNTSNPNEFYFIPGSSQLVSGVNKPSKHLIKTVFKYMDINEVHSDFPQFMRDFAKTHRGFYDALVGGRNYNTAIKNLLNTSFEGALVNHTMDRALNNPFPTVDTYQRFTDELSQLSNVNDTFSELFRSVLDDGSLIDPMTAHKIRQQFIDDPNLTPEAYNSIFKLAQGDVVFNGLQTLKGKFNDVNEGVLIGTLLKDAVDTRRPFVHGKIVENTNPKTILNAIEKVNGEDNFNITKNCD